MNIKTILKTIEHRPWEIPNRSWMFYQEWRDAIFLHWEVNVEELKKYIPQELEIDLFEGKAWISAVAFTMKKTRPKHLPSFQPISDFHEINIRTYVKYNGKAGVYFLSIEGHKRLSCFIAKKMSELPYRYSPMARKNNTYTSNNQQYKDTFDIRFKIGKAMTNKTNLDRWLTERYALFQDTKKMINEFEIHHIEWPINELTIETLNLSYPRFKDLFSGQPDKVHYSPGVQVVAWDKQSSLRKSE